jgi:multimeric flavodoxin WrbA
MNIVVLNGSPKGEISVTLQYVHYLEKHFPQHQFSYWRVAQSLRKLENSPAAFDEVIEAVRAADGVLWAFPLYTMLVHSNYKRFIELIFERQAAGAFQGKYAAALSTSIHFYDHTAHNYIHAICDDLAMNYVGGFSAAMYDLQQAQGREHLSIFGEHFFNAIAAKAPMARRYPPLVRSDFQYVPGIAQPAVALGDKKLVVITDAREPQANLRQMVARFTGAFSAQVEVVNLWDVDIKGGCLGCLHCGYDNTCAYEGQDDFTAFYRAKVMTADILVFAGTITDRYLSARWKTFFDRRFFNTHSSELMGKQVGFILSGPLGQLSNLQEMLDGLVQTLHANLVGIVTDEAGEAQTIDRQLQHLAQDLAWYAQRHYVNQTFLGVGGHKIFRDEIWGSLRVAFQADHRFYSRHGFYDFPQADWRTRLQNAFVGPLLGLPRVRAEFQKRTKEGMIAPLKKVVESL